MSTGEAHVAFLGKTKFELEQMVDGNMRIRRTNGDGVEDMFFPRSLVMDFAREHLQLHVTRALRNILR